MEAFSVLAGRQREETLFKTDMTFISCVLNWLITVA